MKTMLMILFVLVLSCLPSASAQAAPSKGDVITMKGDYCWTRKKGKRFYDLKGVFTYKGDKSWDAVFTFKWGKKDHIYTGTVKGDLNNGKVSGEILNDEKKRSFTFIADVKDGKLKGTHKETTKKRAADTGDFNMKLVTTE